MPKPQIRPAYARLPPLLRSLRENAGFTQRQLAAALGLPQNTVFRMEQGIRRCDAIELIDWALACGADPRKVFGQLVKAHR